MKALCLRAALAAALLAPTAVAAQEFSAAQKEAIERIVREYLVKNPDVLQEAYQELEKRQAAADADRHQAAVKDHAQMLFSSPRHVVLGNPNGDVTMVEFFDYNCGYCRHAVGQVADVLKSDQRVRVVFKEFPIFGEDSEAAAKVALAAGKQGKYWETHQALYERKGAEHVDEALALQVAEGLGLDMAKLKADMASPEITTEIEAVRALADRLGIQGTPHFVIGENVIPGAPQNLRELLSEKIASVRKDGCAVC